MGISEKIIHPDAFHVHLYKEGVFWIAYEQSAYYFWLMKGYKPTKKFVKAIKKEIVSIGFPQSALPANINSNCLMEKDAINLKTFLLEESIDEDAFEQWKMQVPVYDALQAKEMRIETALMERDYKFTLGENLKKEIITLIINVYRANCRENKEKFLLLQANQMNRIYTKTTVYPSFYDTRITSSARYFSMATIRYNISRCDGQFFSR
jgi:hypothetical protein